MVKAVLFDMYETLVTLMVEPKCFGYHIAALAGIPKETFQPHWRETESDRMTGKLSFEESIRENLTYHNAYSDNVLAAVLALRKESRRVPFDHMHPEILPMLQSLRERGVKVALVSNCSTEEAEAIRQSRLFPYFDVPILSSETGHRKPEEAIFRLALGELGVTPEECLYVGDGGSQELEASRRLGMRALQACWYLVAGSTQQVTERKEGFPHLESPLEILGYLEERS